eukprot:scaffold1017_cov363-Pavlova_lutheri.AAC.7
MTSGQWRGLTEASHRCKGQPPGLDRTNQTRCGNRPHARPNSSAINAPRPVAFAGLTWNYRPLFSPFPQRPTPFPPPGLLSPTTSPPTPSPPFLDRSAVSIVDLIRSAIPLLASPRRG